MNGGADPGETLRLVALDDRVEAARADLYGLLARLWAAPADEALLRQFASPRADAPAPGSFLAGPWQALADALRATTPRAAAAEYDALFLGVGKPEVFLYGSYYLSGFLHETPLVALRDELASLGLARDPAAGETEDHIAFLCEVMRYLIAGEDAAVCNLERQRRFWRAHLQPWVERLCDTVQAHEGAAVYAAVAGLTRAFAQVETQALDMVE
jgi:TorA maturation chaperone TorD